MIIDLGCGRWPRPDADLRIDFNDHPQVDIKHDLLVTPYPVPKTEPITKIYLYDVIEHIPVFDLWRVLLECYDLLADDGILDVTVPDVRWIAERIVNGDWKEKAKEHWQNKHSRDFVNAMSYLYGGFYDDKEYKMPGMGHVAGYDEETLIWMLDHLVQEDMRRGWREIKRVPDPRHECILRVQAVK